MNRVKAVVFVAIMAGLSFNAFTDTPLVRIAGDPYPPWAEGEENAEPKGGIAVKISEELFKRMGMDTRSYLYPFQRGLDRIKSGDEDVILMVSRNPERAPTWSFPSRCVK